MYGVHNEWYRRAMTTTPEIIATKDPSAHLDASTRTDSVFGDLIGPARYLAPERARLATLDWPAFDLRPLGSTLGAEISGIDLTTDLPQTTVDEIARALAEWKVIFFRDQPVTSEQHVAFARRFGDLEIHPFIPSNTGVPELVRFEKSAEVGGYENSWHNDVTWREVPSKAAVLHAIHVPDHGGDTLFSDMAAAYDALDDATKERIEGLTAEHDFMRSFSGVVPEERRAEMRELYPVVEHPVVVRHPVTGRRTLYVNRNFTTRILGIDDEAEADALYRRLVMQAWAVEHQVRFMWRKDSIAMWDNMAVQHYASSDYWPEIRIMERASIIGTRPAA